MHPVVAKLDKEHRRKRFANPFFAALDEERQRSLLDWVLDIREGLAHKNALDKLRPQREREVAEVRSAIATIRKDFGNKGFSEEIKDYQGADLDLAHIDLDAIETLMRAIEPVSEIVERFGYAEDDGRQQRTRLPRWEAFNLKDLLSDFGVKISLRTPDDERPNPCLDLIGLLADPPVSGDVILYRLRR
jgi:hypothetical protein